LRESSNAKSSTETERDARQVGVAETERNRDAT